MIANLFVAMPTDTARAFQTGSVDANGQRPERHVSDGGGNPCRHCLTDIAEGGPFLILAYRPFPKPQPFAEIGPIFLHANACDRHDGAAGIPPMFLDRERLLIRGYGEDHRIVYGTGRVVPATGLADAAAELLERPEVAYLHLRSASNNCYQCRIDRA